MIRMPWQRWDKPQPMDPNDLMESEAARRAAERRRVDTEMALLQRRAVVVHNHLAYDIRRALEHRG